MQKAGGKGPKSIMCFLCGQNFGTHSYNIHLKSCCKKWNEHEATKPKKNQRALPEAPEGMDEFLKKKTHTQGDLDAFNEMASQIYNNLSLIKCHGCGRTFTEEALTHHAKSCKGADKDPSPAKGHVPVRPKTVMCYICGKEYGTTSIKIHLKSCIKKWEEQEELKPVKERRPVPEEPDKFEDVLTGKMKALDLEEYNNEAFKAYNEKALVPCKNCGRTFLPDRLEVHLKSCKHKK